MEQQHGILVLNKPKGLSSAQCLGRIKRLGQAKIGHAGTLDPMASGVLLVLLGQATKLSNYLLAGGHKTYLGTLRLGLITDTWDLEGQVLEEKPLPEPSSSEAAALEADIQAGIAAWLGQSEQTVPPYSAAKHKGQPLYKLARAGKEVPVKTKIIEISHTELQWVKLPEVRFRVSCSSGSYIRSLAHSLGMRLGYGATLSELIREYSHPFGLDQACSLDELLAQPELLPQRVLPLHSALPQWEMLKVSPREEADLRFGKSLPRNPDAFGNGTQALAYSVEEQPLALLEARNEGPFPVWTILRGLFTP